MSDVDEEAWTMPVVKLLSGAVFGFREWEFGDMDRWAKKAANGSSGDDILVEATVGTLEEVIDPGPYGWLTDRATALDADGVNKLLKVDIRWWLYCARAASHPNDEVRGYTGDHYWFDWVCSKDKRHVNPPAAKLLSQIPHKFLPQSSVEHVRTGKSFSVTLPNDVVVKFVLPTVGIDKPLRQQLHRETKELRLRKPGAPAVEATQAQVVACQVVHVSSLGENQSFERKTHFVEKLKFREWAVLEKAIRDAAPSIDSTVACFCQECGEKTLVQLPLTHGFFLPRTSEEEAISDQEGQGEGTVTTSGPT